MRLMVGHTTNWDKPYGVIDEAEDYNVDKPLAASLLLDEVADLVTIAKQNGGPAKLILALEPEQGSVVVGAVYQIQEYNLEKPLARASLLGEIKKLVQKANVVISGL